MPEISELDLHDLIALVLQRAGGVLVEDVLPAIEGKRRADILFEDEAVVAEVKTLTNDRSNDPNVKTRINHLVTVEGPEMGGPIIFGTVGVRLDKLPDRMAKKALRILSKRVQREVGHANNQIKDTKAEWKDTAHGLLVIATPPLPINLHVIGWAVHDATVRGHNSSIDSLMQVECDRDLQGRIVGLVVSFHSIGGKGISEELKNQIAEGFNSLSELPFIEASEEEFFKRYEIDP